MCCLSQSRELEFYPSNRIQVDCGLAAGQSLVLLRSAVFRFICAGVPQEAHCRIDPGPLPYSQEIISYTRFFLDVSTFTPEKVHIRGLRG